MYEVNTGFRDVIVLSFQSLYLWCVNLYNSNVQLIQSIFRQLYTQFNILGFWSIVLHNNEFQL